MITTTTIKLASTKNVIDTSSGAGAEKFKTLVEDYLKYLAYLNNWNGELPQVISDDGSAISIIIPNA